MMKRITLSNAQHRSELLFSNMMIKCFGTTEVYRGYKHLIVTNTSKNRDGTYDFWYALYKNTSKRIFHYDGTFKTYEEAAQIAYTHFKTRKCDKKIKFTGPFQSQALPPGATKNTQGQLLYLGRIKA